MNFFLRTDKVKGKATVYVRIKRGGIDWRSVATGIKANIAEWKKNYESGDIAKWNTYTREGEGKKLKESLDEVEGMINVMFHTGEIKSDADKKELTDRLARLANAKGYDALDLIAKKRKEEEEKELHKIHTYAKYYIKGIKSGRILVDSKQKPYREATVNLWRVWWDCAKEYIPATMTFEEISKDFLDGFRQQLKNRGLMQRSVNDYFSKLQRLCNYAAFEGRNGNPFTLSKITWKRITVDESEKLTETYLNDNEINSLYEMQLTDVEDEVRDVFLLGTFLCQRYSDYSILNGDNFTTEGGVDVVKIDQKKTGNSVTGAVLDDRVYRIMEKYGNELPKPRILSDFNAILRRILRRLSDTVPSLKERVKTPLTQRERRNEATYIRLSEKIARGEKLGAWEQKRMRMLNEYKADHPQGEPLYARDADGKRVIKFKYELISSHSARRSGITNLVNEGIYTNFEIMKLSGHKTEATYEGYIRTEDIKVAQRMVMKKKAAEARKQKEPAKVIEMIPEAM